MRFLKQSALIILSFVFVFIWQQTSLSQYTIQILGLFIFLFLLLSAFRKKSGWSFFFLTSIVLLMIFATGALNSNLFFLLYFLSFGIAFVFEPVTVFIFLLGTLLIFLPAALKDDIMGNFIKLGSLVLISPLAFFFGREFRREEKQEQIISDMKEEVDELTQIIEEKEEHGNV